MLCCWFFVVLLCHLSAAQDSVKFPGKVDEPQEIDFQPRFGLKYLGNNGRFSLQPGLAPPLMPAPGHFLNYFGSGFVGVQRSPIQTPTETMTSRPATAITLFSAAASTTPTLGTVTTAKATIPQGLSTFPTAYPTSLPTGIISSVGTFPTIIVSKPPMPTASLTATVTGVCGCLPAAVCVNQTTRTGVSVRIVTPAPSGVTCATGLIYCCSPGIQSLCGLPNVIPGVTPGSGQANLGQYPWSAIILQSDNTYVGGGALIDSTHVLTAAHKVIPYGTGSTLKIRLGDWDLSSTAEPVSYVEVKVSKIVNHPSFDSKTYANDVSIITLVSAAPILTAATPQVNTVCLPEATDTFVGSRCWVAGWGKDMFNGSYQKIIKQVDVPVIATNNCQTKLRATRLGPNYVLDGKSFICAGGETSKDACTGDGGNALVCIKAGQYYVAGITVGGIQCGLANVPGLYANVANFLPWIKAQTSQPGGIDPRRPF